MDDLEQDYFDLQEEIHVGSVADAQLSVTEFFRLFAEVSAENGDTPDLEYAPVLREGAGGFRIDGYAVQTVDDGSGSEHWDLYLAVCDFRQDDQLPTINAKDVDRAASGVARFLKMARDREFLGRVEETSPTFQLAALVRDNWERVRRVRMVLFSNAVLRTRRRLLPTTKVDERPFHINVLDIARYSTIARSGSEPVEIDLEEDFGGALPCLPASLRADGYRSFLFAIPGEVLAEVYASCGSRLLEQNVRTYLQARTKVNKGILKTISKEPEMFFAYNNGITATAADVSIKNSHGQFEISKIRGLQIVNGGQTTASLLYARDCQKRTLRKVFVQVKLSVVDVDATDDIVPRISEYANTQNKVSLADLSSNSPIQVAIEKLSKEVSVPQRAGDLYTQRWFYERARGQYKNMFAYKSIAERKKLQLQYPKTKFVTKTDLAKYEIAFAGRPHHVCEGAQKCFNRYTATELKSLSPDYSLNMLWFQRAMAKAILFRELDGQVLRSEWYKIERGYKAQVVAYAISACAEAFRSSGRQIDLDRIWKEQHVNKDLLAWMLRVAARISKVLRDPPEGVSNISEFAKKEFCWQLHVKKEISKPPDDIGDYGVSMEQFVQAGESGNRAQRLRSDVDNDLKLLELMPLSDKLIAKAKVAGVLSPNNERALRKISGGNINLSRGERNSLNALLERIEIDD